MGAQPSVLEPAAAEAAASAAFSPPGTIDMEEILAIMEEMGLLKNLKTDRITFCSEMFVKYDANDDGVLRRSFATKAAPAPNTASASHPRAQL